MVTMHNRTRSRLIWLVVTVVAIGTFFYFSSAAMTWLRVTMHGR
jgi:hypothetical protein